MLRYKIKQN